MKLSEFEFKLPEEQIAQEPVAHRDECRLMVLHKKTGEIEHRVFKDLLQYFGDGDVMVFNDTKVIPAILHGNKEKTNAKIEVTLLRDLNQETKYWDVLVEPARKIRIGNKLYFGEDDSLVAEVIDNTTSRGRTLRYLYDGTYEEFKKTLYALGKTPLPSYITREATEEDSEWYQTIYARHEGAVVCPAAGTHFSRELIKRLEIKGCELAYVTLHAGLGNFREVEVEDLTKHKTDSEQYVINEDNTEKINNAIRNGKNVCAVGITTMKTLETVVSTDGEVKPKEGWTNKFIFPPYDFKVQRSCISNFHLPFSTMLMMVAAFGGYEKVMNAYDVAVKDGYRFGAYGDAMLII